MAKERWRDISGYKGSYQVSDLGRVRSLDRIKIQNHYSGQQMQRLLKGKILKLNCAKGHRYCHVLLGNKGRQENVHILVLEAFVGPRPPGAAARHYPDQDPKNNRLENLSWGTYSQNNGIDKAENGTHRKLTKADALNIRASRESRKILAKRYGVTIWTISDIRGKGTWQYV